MSKLGIFLATGPFVISVDLGERAPYISAGGAVWDSIDRPRTYAYTHFSGVELFEQTIDVAIDQYPDGDIEPIIKLIEDRRIPTPKIPDVLRLAGPNVKRTDLAWILVGIEYQDDDEYRDDGRRCRQSMTLTFRQHNAPQVVVHNSSPAAAAAPPAAASTGSSGGERTYTVKAGDTLSGIAQKMYGSSARWQDIANASGVRDPRSLKVGQVLKVPA
ncbi:LysM peptidoglycan-binding domain-containing protein [Kineococcus sp. T13]|uniref:LysM peptidoglycan-binding domain-containing protein n=1 Tax=Kineococcus vitellinus TaxID=2696565 RepID=UPI0014121597|nr:LysM domain-containing protein [Kineococcus vitellinus]NAZ73849.1 LysM peptidoglycan-binding domain-containing protein [Kineococcus vitellinus]